MTTEGLTILVDQARAFLARQWDAFESQDKYHRLTGSCRSRPPTHQSR